MLSLRIVFILVLDPTGFEGHSKTPTSVTHGQALCLWINTLELTSSHFSIFLQLEIEKACLYLADTFP